MASTTFVDGVTKIISSWLNDVNATVYSILGNGTVSPPDKATARTNLGVPALDGTGATGTWPVNVTGSAGSSASATTAVSLAGGTTTTPTLVAGNAAILDQQYGRLVTLTYSSAGIYELQHNVNYNGTTSQYTLKNDGWGAALVLKDGSLSFKSSNTTGLPSAQGAVVPMATVFTATAYSGSGVASVYVGNSAVTGITLYQDGSQTNYNFGAASGFNFITFGRSFVPVGSITQSGTTGVAYNTTSDYRLKATPGALTGSGAFIDALRPVTWTWIPDGTRGVGFIAHEVQAVSPGSVHGEKDAVDSEGKPIYQSMEYGSAEFIANIIAEVQNLRRRVAALEARP